MKEKYGNLLVSLSNAGETPYQSREKFVKANKIDGNTLRALELNKLVKVERAPNKKVIVWTGPKSELLIREKAAATVVATLREFKRPKVEKRSPWYVFWK